MELYFQTIGRRNGMTFDSNDNLFIGNQKDQSIKGLDKELIVRSELKDPRLQTILAMKFNKENVLNVAVNGKILKNTREGKLILFCDMEVSRKKPIPLKKPYSFGICFDDRGFLYFCDSYNNCIRKVSSAGEVSTFCGNEDGNDKRARLDHPHGIVFNKSLQLFFVADFGNKKIRSVTIDGIVSDFFTLESNPCSIAINGAGFLFFSTIRKSGIIVLSSEGKQLTILETNLDNIYDIEFNGRGDMIVKSDDAFYILKQNLLDIEFRTKDRELLEKLLRMAEKDNKRSNTTPSSEKETTDVSNPKETRTHTLESREQIGDYILMEKIGKGTYGIVYKGLHLREGNTVAIKVLNLDGVSQAAIKSLQAEINLLKLLAHRNIVRYIGYVSRGEELSFVMEYIENGSLSQMVKKYGRFPETLAKTYVKKVLTGLEYLHQQGVIHRDVQPDNILITKDGDVKLADFGVSTKLKAIRGTDIDDARPAGTPYYSSYFDVLINVQVAPEVIEFDEKVTPRSLGCTSIELLKGEPPYSNYDPFSAMYKMVEDKHPPLPSGVSMQLTNFFLVCFNKNVNMRPSSTELMKHQWLKNANITDMQNAIEEIEKYTENSNPEDEGEYEGTLAQDMIEKRTKIGLISKFSNVLTLNPDEAQDELNVDIEEDESEALREKEQEALISEIKAFIQIIKVNAGEDKIKKSCQSLSEIFTRNPHIVHLLIPNHGLPPLIRILKEDNTTILNSVLRLITQIIENEIILVNLCIMGIIPQIIVLSNKKYSVLTRLYCAYFVQRVLSLSETLQMFVACNGLAAVVELLDTDYRKAKELIQIAIDCVSSFFQLQTTTPKSEFLHLFLNVGLLQTLSITLLQILHGETSNSDDSAEGDESYIEKVTNIFMVFSVGDSDAKLGICSKNVISKLKEAMLLMDPKSKESLNILKIILNLSFDRLTLSALGDFIVPLLNIALEFVNANKFHKEIFNPMTQLLFHLCRKNKQRQETAVKAGLIPFLVFAGANNRVLKEFTVPLICDLAGSSKVARLILLENNIFQFYLKELGDSNSNFRTDAMEAIAVCLENEKEKVENLIASPQTLSMFKEVISNTPDYSLVALLESLTRILTVSALVSQQLGLSTKEGEFVSVLKGALHHPNPHARVMLLKTLNMLLAKYIDPPHFLKNNKLLNVVEFIEKNDTSNVVKNMAQQLLQAGGQN